MSRARRGASLARTLFAATVLAVVLATVARAELTQKGDLFVRFDGGIAPRALPRSSPAPIAVRIEGTIRSIGGQRPPALRRIRIALNREGRINTRGLPVCHRDQLETATPTQALAACGPALVGGGSFTAKTSFPDQSNVVSPGEILLFNSVVGGGGAILAHVYQASPGPITRLIVFRIRRDSGTFGTVLTGELPASLNRNGYLKTILLQIQRRYVFRGRPTAYLSAACPAPEGFAVAVFPFARASMTFDDGRTLHSTLIRSCRAKG